MVYFMYSDEQIKERNNILNKSGKEFVPGLVTVGPKKVKYTQSTTNVSSMSRFIDAKVVATAESYAVYAYIKPSTKLKTYK